MSDLIEVLLTSDISGSMWTCCAWDPHTATNLMVYKGGGAATPHALSLINNEFIVSADNAKPLIHIWPVNSQEQLQGSRLVTPSRVTSLSISPDGNYCVAGAGENIYIWQICSGKLLAVLSRHYQSVTTIKFTDDGSHFVSAGQDGMVLVWKLSQVVSPSYNQQPNPLYSFSDHALRVSDIHIGKGGMRAYMVTVSIDRTCKVYDLSSGSLLLTLVFQEALTAVVLDHLDTKIYVGSIDGHIYEFSLQAPPRMKEYHLTNDDVNNKFSGHNGSITTLSISLDGESLISGGKDENVLLWNIPSKQLIRTLPHKGAISNAFFLLASKSMFDEGIKLNLIFNSFKRMIENDNSDNHVVEILVTDKMYDDDMECGNMFNVEQPLDKTLQSSQELEQLRLEVKSLKNANRELYAFSLKNVFNGK